ncbi:hypothetical protein [Paenibacillus phocaensis]|nr:hypothetical protein [Paenibacillus phocaensis]
MRRGVTASKENAVSCGDALTLEQSVREDAPKGEREEAECGEE